MPRPTSKNDLLTLSEENFKKLMQTVDGMSEKALSTPFDFSADNKKEAHWARDKDVKDVFIHLYEWHQLLLNWVKNNKDGGKIAFLPAPYNWKNYGDMNRAFWEKHRNTSLEDARAMLEKSHNDVMKLADKFSNEELFTRSYFDWTGNSALGSYFVSNMSSHYDWALKKLKAHIRKVGK